MWAGGAGAIGAAGAHGDASVGEEQKCRTSAWQLPSSRQIWGNQDPLILNQWLRHWANGAAVPELGSPLIALGLLKRLILSQTSQLGPSWPQSHGRVLSLYAVCHYPRRHGVVRSLSTTPNLQGSES